MCKANFAIRRTLSLDSQLQKQLVLDTQLIRKGTPQDTQFSQAEAASLFKPSMRNTLGICCCKRPDIKFIFDNLSRHSRPLLRKPRAPKGVKVPLPPVRSLMGKHGVFIKFTAGAAGIDFPLPLPGPLQQEREKDEWPSCYEESSRVNHGYDSSSLPMPQYIHIGHINLQTYHFACLLLEEIQNVVWVWVWI